MLPADFGMGCLPSPDLLAVVSGGLDTNGHDAATEPKDLDTNTQLKLEVPSDVHVAAIRCDAIHM